MKLMFASDVHGSAYFAEKMKDLYEKEQAQKLILLGDLLYHGPRNALPKEYDPPKVAAILNDMKNELLCVRGNCDAEVDQMVLEFPIMADYTTIFTENRMLFITHGHIYNNENLPMLKENDVLIHGHTHLLAIKSMTTYTYVNPGSISIPKGGNENSYMILENNVFTIKNLDMNPIISDTV